MAQDLHQQPQASRLSLSQPLSLHLLHRSIFAIIERGDETIAIIGEARMRSLDLLASLTAQRKQRNGIVIRKPGKRNVQTDLMNEVLYPSILGILETRERQAETPGEQLMKIGTEKSPEGQDTIRMLETTETQMI
jgi:hypothetical protein